jgi:UDP-glucose-4-epimerase GalE
VRWGALEVGDIADAGRLDEVFRRHKPDAVMHFAAFAYVGESVSEPAKYYRNNVVGSLALVEAAMRNGCDKVIFSSSCATYGIPDQLPITETTPQLPINPYGYTKLVVERLLSDFHNAYGLKWAAMRYFNAAGCDRDGELGERHAPETHAIPLAILAALGNGQSFKVFGTDYQTADGTAVRDYVHVSDLASAHVLAAAYLQGGGDSGAFNLSTGRGTSVRDIVQSVEKATGRKVPVENAARREGDPPVLFAIADKARDVLQWQPRFVDIDPIVASAVAWFSQRQNM